MEFQELKEKVIQWAKERGIFEKGEPLAQLQKTQEELDETINAIEEIQDLYHHPNKPDFNEVDGIMDGIGDMLVTIIILASMMNLEIEDCLEVAYNEIKNRTGKMVDGQFVKDR